MPSSILTDYMKNYGSRLQSVMQPQDAASQVVGTAPVTGSDMQTHALSTAPSGSALQTEPGVPNAPSTSELAMPAAQPTSQATQAQGTSVSDVWQKLPKEEKDTQLSELEKVLAKGNETIDSAYDQMQQKLGARPDNKLTREDKGMLLMQFGLSLMQASSGDAYGKDLGGAIGAAGSQTLGTYQGMKQSKLGEQKQFDSKREAIEGGRTASKSKLAQETGTQQIKSSSALAEARNKADIENNQVTGTLDTEEGVYGYTKGGKASALLDENGKKLKARDKPFKPSSEPLIAVDDGDGGSEFVPRSEAVGRKKAPSASAKGKPFKMTATDSNTIYRQSVGLFGGMFDPISGRISGLSRDQSEQVQKIASRASELYREGGGEVDHASAIDQAFGEIKNGGAQSKPAAAAAAPASEQSQQFKSEQEVGAAIQSGSIKIGDVVTVNGKRFKVQ